MKYLLKTDTDRTIHLHFHHAQPNTHSDVQVLIIASGETKVKLDATVTIEKEAINSTAKLSIQVVAMDGAKVQAAPNLEILGNQVQASHSLSTFHLTDNALFYLTSRGLSRGQARQLVINELSDRFRDGVKL